MKKAIRDFFNSSPLKIFLLYSFLFILTLSCYRLLFYAIYSYRLMQDSPLLVGLAFLLGLRFDLATLGMLLGLPFLLSSLWFFNRLRIYTMLWGILPIFLYFWMFAILIADLLYFENASKHIGYEAFVFLGSDLGVIFSSAWEQNPLTFLSGVLILAIGIPSLSYLYYKKNPYQSDMASVKIQILRLLFTILATLFAFRGGFQEVPLRSSSAIISNDAFINNLALNGAYTAIMDMKGHSIPKSEKMPLSKAVQIFQRKANYPGAKFISKKYPLLRVTKAKNNHSKMANIVLILLENWSGKFVSPYQHKKIDGHEVTPFFNRMAEKGIFFSRFFASGGRTTNGMMAILSGIPDWPGLTAVRTPKILGNFSGLASIVKRLGYQTLFVTGGDLKFDNKKTLLPHWGFEKALGFHHIQSLQKYKKGAWGYDDSDTLEVLHQEILKLDSEKPFLATALTLTTHYPYRVPEDKYKIFSEKTKDYEFLNVYHYADAAIHRFIEKAKTAAYYDNTIFLFVADHTHHRYLNYYQDRNIPFLIYGKKIKPQLRREIACQMDILPTIIGYTARKVYYSGMGRDLNQVVAKPGQAYFAYGPVYGWIEQDTFFYRGAQGQGQFIMRASPPFAPSTICSNRPDLCQSLYDNARAYLNLSLTLVDKNRVFPDEEELQQIIQSEQP